MFISFFENIESERHLLAFFTLKESNKKKKNFRLSDYRTCPPRRFGRGRILLLRCV